MVAWTTGSIQYALRPKSDFYYRNIIDCIKYLLRQRAYVTHMLWEPVKLFNKDNERIYSEMNMGSWWWDQQRQIPVGPILVLSSPFGASLEPECLYATDSDKILVS
ncbi:hypothetical protein BGX38DRAFT_497654 [Terfezia claveryi]|nr:hypothetical protein BGX38DRAFT_497654 [Terfezia claveryi]